MKKVILLMFSIVLLSGTVFSQQHKFPYIEIQPDEAELNVGDTLLFKIIYHDTSNTQIDTTCSWSLKPANLGVINENSLFVAENAGEGYIIAQLDTLIDSVLIKIEAEEIEYVQPKIEISPEEVELAVGDTVVFTAKYFDITGNQVDTSFTWSLNPENLGVFENDSLFIASKAGEGYIYAQLDTLIDSAYIKIEDDTEHEKQKIKIVCEGKSVFLNDTTEFNIVYCDSLGNEVDTIGTWEVIPDYIGEFINENLFVGKSVGEARIYAYFGSLVDSMDIEVKERKEFDLQANLTLFPKDTVINLGGTVQYIAKNRADEIVTPSSWEMSGMDVGTLSSSGELVANRTGFSIIKAYLDNSIGTSFLMVEDSEGDEEINNIVISSDHNSPKKPYKELKKLKEGEMWKIGGLSHPLNIYNGGVLYFPVGSLTEDIRIHVSVPEFADVDDDSVEFGKGKEKVLSAITFQVFRNDTVLVEPYYFNSPLIAGLVYKKGLLKQYNVEPNELGLYFMNEAGNDYAFDSTGIDDKVLDFYKNRIFSSVAHFSTLAIKGKSGGSDIVEDPVKPKIEITPDDAELSPGDSLLFTATYYDTLENPVDTTFTWYLKPSNLGTLTDDNLFIAGEVGKGYIFAQLDTLIDSAYIEIEDTVDFEKPKLKILHDGKVVFLNDTTEFDLVYCDSLGNKVDTIATTWSVKPDSIGKFIDGNHFVANKLGNATIFATLGEFSDSLDIEVRTPKNFNLNHSLVVVPEDTVINLGASIKYEALKGNDDGTMLSIIPDLWQIDGMDIGTLSSDGSFVSENVGFGLVNATLDSNIGTAFVIVEDSTNDEEINKITITIDHPSKNQEYKTIKTLSEGEKWKIVGLAHPLNIYNGSMLYFPVGCLSEDIRIHVDIPKFAKDKGDTVEIKHKTKKVLTAINFQVFREDTIHVEPYFFDTPLIAGLIYKRGLLAQYDIEPLDLGLYFVSGDTNDLEVDSTGINNTVLDYYHNKIYSSVAHFSTLAVMGKSTEITNIKEEMEVKFAEEFELYQNYPNPFNPTTNIKFSLIYPAKVNITIYDILGKPVEHLTNDNYSAGNFTIQWQASNHSSGIYFIHMKVGNKSKIVRSLLLK